MPLKNWLIIVKAEGGDGVDILWDGGKIAIEIVRLSLKYWVTLSLNPAMSFNVIDGVGVVW